jgi:DNA-binding NarL/FixJ family response regulator
MPRWGRTFTELAAGLFRRDARTPERPVPPAPPRLPPRKLQVARLVASGLSNKEIARELTIKERTVEAHLEQLRARLGLRNRAQVAAWAVVQGLVGEDEAPDVWGNPP